MKSKYDAHNTVIIRRFQHERWLMWVQWDKFLCNLNNRDVLVPRLRQWLRKEVQRERRV